MILYECTELPLTTGEIIAYHLSQIVQAWICAERRNQRLVVKWPTLPEGITLHNFYQYRTGYYPPTLYKAKEYRIEEDRYLLSYYYQRIFSQMLLVSKQFPLPSIQVQKRLVFWGDTSLLYRNYVLNRYNHLSKLCYYFPDPKRDLKQAQQEGLTTVRHASEDWENLFFLRACEVIVAPDSAYLRTIIFSSTRKELWLVGDHTLTLLHL